MKPGYLDLGPGTVPGSVGHMQHAAAWVGVSATRRAPAPSLLPSVSPLTTAAFFGHIPGNTALLACKGDWQLPGLKLTQSVLSSGGSLFRWAHWPPTSSTRAAARHFDLFSIKPIKTTNCSYHLHWDYAQHQLTLSSRTCEGVLFSLRAEPWQTICLTVGAHYHLGDRLVGRMVSGLIEHSPALFSVLFLLPSLPASLFSFLLLLLSSRAILVSCLYAPDLPVAVNSFRTFELFQSELRRRTSLPSCLDTISAGRGAGPV